ncbi:hypothetical protein C798_19485 [Herbaspirillum rubrisubalbicans Os34]|uniref:Uncharacterized protein n=1 Tax=Herbaspirillum rubrisubalbicans Os34 TaxID=1235827 RepID=A0A6M3ZWR5_9BURK|nr:hypothetical protein [Herbaspirillum rubrisubalbicans]QJQ02340.1 hypothetical protein C798_19485 [Herbaspirillum rubrisubalbicans Os34]
MNQNIPFDMKLKALEEKATDRLLMSDVFDELAFADLYSHICTLAEQLKSEYVISKQLLATILGAASAIRSRSEYLPQVKKSVKLADDFEMVLSLVAVGEAPNDRRPGVPRVC